MNCGRVHELAGATVFVVGATWSIIMRRMRLPFDTMVDGGGIGAWRAPLRDECITSWKTDAEAGHCSQASRRK